MLFDHVVTDFKNDGEVELGVREYAFRESNQKVFWLAKSIDKNFKIA